MKNDSHTVDTSNNGLWVISGCADLRMWQRIKGG